MGGKRGCEVRIQKHWVYVTLLKNKTKQKTCHEGYTIAKGHSKVRRSVSSQIKISKRSRSGGWGERRRKQISNKNENTSLLFLRLYFVPTLSFLRYL